MAEMLTDDDVFDVLANRRRRFALECLLAHSGSLSLSELADEIASRETGQDTPPSAKRHSIYTALDRTHLPKLDSLGIVDYDTETKDIVLDEQRLDLCVEIIPPDELTWAEYYLALGVVALATVVVSLLGIPFVAVVDPTTWAASFILLYVGSALYHLRSRSRRVLGSIRL